jgi:hypothetical protein
MHVFEDIKPGARLRGLDPAGIAEVVQVAHFGPDALNLVFRVDGRVGERLVYRGEENGFEFLEAVSRITHFEGQVIALFDGLPAGTSRAL